MVTKITKGISSFALFCCLSTSLLASNCSYDDQEQIKIDAIKAYKLSKEHFDLEDYSKSYLELENSRSIYESSTNKLKVVANCYHIIPGPFGSKRQRYNETETYDFQRVALAKDIGKFIPPRPLLVIESFIEDTKLSSLSDDPLKQKVTVINILKTNDNKTQTVQMPISAFNVTLNGETQNLGKIESQKEKVVVFEKTTALNTKNSISTTEMYDYNIASY